jgi:regulator of protease activity HflC (stomatin/prohibitin superfamily)
MNTKLLKSVIQKRKIDQHIPPIAGFIFAIILMGALKVAAQWEKVIVLRLGKFIELKGPALVIPIIDLAVMWIDHRVAVTSFFAEKTLAKDTINLGSCGMVAMAQNNLPREEK